MPAAHRSARRAWTSIALFIVACAAALAASAAGNPSRASAQAASTAASPAAEQSPTAPQSAKTVILVRHAEKDPAGDKRDPALSEQGRQRALVLARMLAPAGVSAFYASEYHRTQDTLAPLAERAGKQVTVIPAAKQSELIAAIDALPAGAVCIVAGHSNTVPAIAHALGVELGGVETLPQGPALKEDAYGRMFVLQLCAREPADARAATLLELSYGE